MMRWMSLVCLVSMAGCATTPQVEVPVAAPAPSQAPAEAPEPAAPVAQNEAARAMAQQVCGSPHLDAALTALGTRAGELAGLPEDTPELELPEWAAAQCLRDMAATPIPADAVVGPPVSPSVAALVCACRTEKCQVWAARQPGADAPTAAARQEALMCLRGGHQATLAARAMQEAVCACADFTCARQAASLHTDKLMRFKHLRGSKADIAAIKAAGEATAVCMKAMSKRTPPPRSDRNRKTQRPVKAAATPSDSPR